MHYSQNHIWCSDTQDNSTYNCRHSVTIESHLDVKDYQEKKDVDWTNCIIEKDFFNEERYNNFIEIRKENGESINEESLKSISVDTTYQLKLELLKWLKENIKDRTKHDNNNGWNIGSELYLSKNVSCVTIFFHRRRDALNFIKQFSVYKNPTFYLNYFKDIRKIINFNTLKLEMYKNDNCESSDTPIEIIELDDLEEKGI